MAIQDGSRAIAPGAARRRLVDKAIETWKKALIDLGGRNTLLYFRDLRRGTLDLSPGVSGGRGGQPSLLPQIAGAAASEDRALARLLSGKPVRLSELFPDAAPRRDAARRARTIRARARENDQERGLETLYLAYGLATWRRDPSPPTPNAPVLLYGLTLTPVGARAEDFTLKVGDAPELNQALLHLLETDFNVTVDPDQFLADADKGSTEGRTALLRRFGEACRNVPDFAITPRVVVGNFSYAKLSLVRDLERAQDAIAAHPLLAAIAGDESARDELRERHAAIDFESLPAVPPPADEFLVLDADSSQSRVIAAAVAGADLVVVGPPGTGKSQTIANLVATLTARGNSVLFVAEKRAAIDAVSERLRQQNLGDLLFDLHGGSRSRKEMWKDIRGTLASAKDTLEPDLDALHAQLSEDRQQLEDYAAQLHAEAPPWGLSPFEVQQRLLGLADAGSTRLRLRGDVLGSLTKDVAEGAAGDIRRFVELDGPGVAQGGDHPWARAYAARRVTSEAAVLETLETLDELRLDALPKLRDAMRALRGDSDLREPASLDESGELISLGEALDGLLADCRAGVLALDLDGLAEDLAPAEGVLSRVWAVLFNRCYRRARTALRDHLVEARTPDRVLLTLTRRTLDVRARWRRLSTDGGRPMGPLASVGAARAAFERVLVLLEHLDKTTGGVLDRSQPLGSMEAALDALARDRAMLMRFPELHRLDGELRNLGLGAVLDEVCAAKLTPEQSARRLEYVWLTSILDRIVVPRPALAQFGGEAHMAAVGRFADADRKHVATGSDRVRRAWAERSVRAQDAHPGQAQQVRTQAVREAGWRPIRETFESAGEVLTAVKPCWVMSPLAVAQVLPPRPCFDVVVFDEASQIQPADAVSSLLRGRRAVVAGDPHQLPPTTFFLTGGDRDDEHGADDDLTEDEQAELLAGKDLALTGGIESVLDAMLALLPTPYGRRTLEWHYRSQDERLIAFSNAHIYDNSLKTFPGVIADEPLRHILVPFRPGAGRVTASTPGEVARVVELVIEHARTRPEESLGVIALGIPPALAIEEALRLARGDAPEVEAFFDEDQTEPPFVKNLERVQGDERAAIILTTGYGKTVDGRMRYQFGPLTKQGGERRLNVAITRARRRMTVVSSFAGGEMDPERLRSEGAKMLRDYLLYAASGGADLGLRAIEKPPLNGFERDVKEQLEAQGVPLVPQYGASGYWIDFAAMHPDRPGQPVLAIEADGASYHSSPTARDRDRLRQEHLERLGWRFHRVWSTEWFRNREVEVERAVETWRQAVRSYDNGDDPQVGVPDRRPPKPPVSQPPVVPTRGDRPSVPRGQPITQYTRRQLRQIVQWVKSDGRNYTEDQLLSEVMRDLGFKKRGKAIVRRIQLAIAAKRDA